MAREEHFRPRKSIADGIEDRPLIGVIDAGTRTVKFCVFRSQETKEIAEHAIDVVPHIPMEGWHEQDPYEILNAVKKCMENVIIKLGAQGKWRYLIIIS